MRVLAEQHIGLHNHVDGFTGSICHELDIGLLVRKVEDITKVIVLSLLVYW